MQMPHRGSSTRAEFAAVIFALTSHIPINVGIDSLAAITTINRILYHIKQRDDNPNDQYLCNEWPCGKPWALIDDGDVLRQLYDICTIRGGRSILLTKVKGHATEEDIILGKANIDDKAGNDKADEIANDGVNTHGGETAAIGRFDSKRKDLYARFIHWVQKFIVNALEADNARRNNTEHCDAAKHQRKKTKQKQITNDTKSRYGKDDATLTIYMGPYDKTPPGNLKTVPDNILRNLYDVIGHLKIQAIPSGEQ